MSKLAKTAARGDLLCANQFTMAQRSGVFIDLFAGCGGFSQGFSQAGWQGLFAIERNTDAFRTFALNFLSETAPLPFDWPDWLPKTAHNIRRILKKHRKELLGLAGSVDLVIGGPPCQGFSMAGARREDDSRNSLYKAYVEFVKLVQPKFVLLENVRGISIAHGKSERKARQQKAGRPSISHAERIVKGLEAAGYEVSEPRLILASRFGVPQRRPRVFFFGYLKSAACGNINIDLFKELERTRMDFLRSKGLTEDTHVADAISDLLRRHGVAACDDPDSPRGFELGLYGNSSSALQRLLRNGHKPGQPVQSHRFARHRPATLKRFEQIQRECRSGVQLSSADKKTLGISKHVIVPLKSDQVGHTLTTLPDDYIHYSEPRILTAREYARLQTFPDTFGFEGTFTTGGARRKTSCPRYTQIGNAVPPLLAEAIARSLASACRNLR